MSGDKLTEAEAALAECLGRVVAEMRQQWERERALIAAEARTAVAELRAAMLEIALETRDPASAAKLRTISGARAS